MDGPMLPLELLLRENNVDDYDERVLYQLIEFQYRTTKTILQKCKTFSGGSPSVTENSVRLAVDYIEDTRRPSPDSDVKTSVNLLHSIRFEEATPLHYFTNDRIHAFTEPYNSNNMVVDDQETSFESSHQYNVKKKAKLDFIIK